MKISVFIVSLFLISCINVYSQQQHEVIDMRPIDVVGDRQPRAEPNGRSGGPDKPGRSATPGKNNPNAPGKKSVSQQCKQETDEALEAYDKVDAIPGTETQIKDKLKEIRDDAGRQGRTADRNYVDGIIKKMSDGIDIEDILTALEEITFVKLLNPDITHNVLIKTPSGPANGMKITIPGYIKNAIGTRSELVVRFYQQNGTALFANVQEPYFRDINNLVIVGTGLNQVEETKVDTETYTLYIPYYALNFYPTGGKATHYINAKASVYLDNKLVASSPLTSMFITY